jgi:RimJ/RimL family protein N-acetyltransferase
MNTEHLNLTLRQAVESDSESLLEWRNDATTKAFSLSSDEVTREQHVAWFNKALQDKSCLLIIGEVLGDPIGMVRINILDHSGLGQVSINLNPDFRGRGISRQLLGASLLFGTRILDNISKYSADIHVENVASQKIFNSVGFVKSSETTKGNFESYVVDSDSVVVSY